MIKKKRPQEQGQRTRWLQLKLGRGECGRAEQGNPYYQSKCSVDGSKAQVQQCRRGNGQAPSQLRRGRWGNLEGKGISSSFGAVKVKAVMLRYEQSCHGTETSEC